MSASSVPSTLPSEFFHLLLEGRRNGKKLMMGDDVESPSIPKGRQNQIK